MAKSDSFFIRGEIAHATAAGLETSEIDLGSFVNIGPKSSTLMRILNIDMCVQDTTNPESAPTASASGGDLNVLMQLTTQEASDALTLNDKSVVASGRYLCLKDGSDVIFTDTSDYAAPQHWTDGYLVGVDTLFWSAINDQASAATFTCSFVMECRTETATQASSTALAISQQ